MSPLKIASVPTVVWRRETNAASTGAIRETEVVMAENVDEEDIASEIVEKFDGTCLFDSF